MLFVKPTLFAMLAIPVLCRAGALPLGLAPNPMDDDRYWHEKYRTPDERPTMKLKQATTRSNYGVDTFDVTEPGISSANSFETKGERLPLHYRWQPEPAESFSYDGCWLIALPAIFVACYRIRRRLRVWFALMRRFFRSIKGIVARPPGEARDKSLFASAGGKRLHWPREMPSMSLLAQPENRRMK